LGWTTATKSPLQLELDAHLSNCVATASINWMSSGAPANGTATLRLEALGVSGLGQQLFGFLWS